MAYGGDPPFGFGAFFDSFSNLLTPDMVLNGGNVLGQGCGQNCTDDPSLACGNFTSYAVYANYGKPVTPEGDYNADPYVLLAPGPNTTCIPVGTDVDFSLYTPGEIIMKELIIKLSHHISTDESTRQLYGLNLPPSNCHFVCSAGSLTGAYLTSAGDLLTVDTMCGTLMRIEARALDPNANGGRVFSLVNLTTDASFIPIVNGTIHQDVYLAADTTKKILYAAYANQCGIVKLDLNAFYFLDWAVQPLCGYGGDGDPASGGDTVRVSNDIRQLTVGGPNNLLYFADSGNNRIRCIDTRGRIQTIAGSGAGIQFSGDDGPATAATLWQPTGVAVVKVDDASAIGGSRWVLYISDTGNHIVVTVWMKAVPMHRS